MNKKKVKRLICQCIWLFIVGAFLGFLFETLWCYIKTGELINKQGLWYGPFKPIYGIGLILITVFLYKIKDKNIIFLFLGGVIIGSVFEYAASLFQEYSFGTSTWSYKGLSNNLNGRIYLPYSLAWGAISVIWLKYGINLFKKTFNKIDGKKFRILTIIISIFTIYNISLTTLIVHRYAERMKNINSNNIINKYLDKKYPSWKIKKKFPNLKVKK